MPRRVQVRAYTRRPGGGRKAKVFPCPWCGVPQKGNAAFREHFPKCPKGPNKETA